jgi:hypothetical protein
MLLLEPVDVEPVMDAAYDPTLGHVAEYPLHAAEEDSRKK